MKFCNACGAMVDLRDIPGESQPRFQCQACALIHYQNPKLVAGCLPLWEDKILLCKRAIEPSHGKWTLPAGYIELGETAEEGAVREAREEANIEVQVIRLFSVYSIPHVSHIQIMFLCRLLEEKFSPGVESLEVRLFREEDIPWGELSFPSITFILKNYFADKKAGVELSHHGYHRH